MALNFAYLCKDFREASKLVYQLQARELFPVKKHTLFEG